MSQIENSRICPIARTLSTNSSQNHSVESTNPFLKTPLRSTHLAVSVNSTIADTSTTTTSSEKRLNFALQSRKNSSDVRSSGERNPECKSEAFAHSNNRSTFEFWRSQVETRTVESSRVTSSPQTVQHLQASICNVNLGVSVDGTLSADSGVSTTRQPNQEKNVDVKCEVESVQKGGDETASTQDDATVAEEILTEASSSNIVSAGLKENKQQPLEQQQQQQNSKPKPILKRQDVPISIVALPPAATLPPPILKKRDSFSGINEYYSTAQQSCAIHVQNVITSAKPASILKNRQPRGSYSFEENVHVSDMPSSFDDGAHLLKPILKKKSWSIEEKVAVSTNSFNLNEAVKGILKTTSSDSFSASSSRKNSAVDELAVLSISSAITQSSSTASPTKATLKGILKTSPKVKTSSRSASISPSSSFEALSDDTELDAVPLPPSPPKPTTSAAIFCREVSSQEEYSPPDVPSSDSIMSHSDFTVQQHEQLYSEVSPSNQQVHEVVASSAKPTLFKTNSVHTCPDSDSPSDSPLSSSETHTSEYSVSQSVPSSQLDDAVNDESPSQESSADTALSDHESCEETDLSSMNLTVFRPKAISDSSDAASKSRPKSCLVTSAELLGGKSLASSSIAQRLALLKQSGEEGWKNRVQKADVEKEIVSTAAVAAANTVEEVRLRPKKTGDTGDVGLRGSVITNRLSCLIDSQAQWKSRVSESDAKQFTVASKQNRHSAVVTPAKSTDVQTPKMDPTEKVVLRGTPKRLGLRGSTLNESALNAVSSKLNNVLRPDKSMLSGPLSPIRKKTDDSPSSPVLDAPKLDVKLTRTPLLNTASTTATSSTPPTTVYLSRPDDEDSFGSFFGLDSSKLDHILKQEAKTAEPNLILLDSLSNEPTSLLTHVKRTRVAPKRRAASSHNPIKQLNKSDIPVDSYSHSQVPNPANGHQVPDTSKLKGNAPVEHYAKNNLAISALAGLASKEDFKKVATQLRSSTGVNSSGNDTWRQHDLKNSIQSRMLILVKGRRHAQIRLVKPSWRSLNLADSFILVTKDTSVFAFVGTYSNIIERSKCIEVADHIRKRREMCYRSVNNNLVLIDGHAETAQENLFLKAQPLLKQLDWSEGDKGAWEEMVAAKQSEASADEDDEYFEESQICTNKIFEAVYNESDGSLALEPVARYWGRRPVHQLLQPDSAFVFDFCFEVYVWLGKYASNTLRQKAVDAAKDLFLQGYHISNIDISLFGDDLAVKSDKRPDWAWFTRVHQNMEPILFKDKFSNWPAFTLTRSVKTKSQRTALKCDSTKDNQGVKKGLSEELKLFPADVEQMINKQVQPEFQLEGISEEGEFKVLTIDMQCLYINDSGELVELDGNSLYTGESYCIRWKYRINRITRSLTGGESKHSDVHGGRDRLLYFLWVGKNARALDSCTTALHAVEKVREEGADQMMIENGKEFPVFLRIFSGSLVILLGKRIQGSTEQKYRMFSLKSVKTDEMFLNEVECSSRNLRSRSSFLFTNVSSSKVIYIWHGCKAPSTLRKLIKQFLEEKLLASKPTEFGFTKHIDQFDVVELEEGKESKEFVNLINGSMETSSPKRTSRVNLQRDIYFSLLDDDRPYDFTPRLFHFTTSPLRVFQASEVVPSYMPNRESATFLDYPFTQEDLYICASTRPTFFLLDNHYEVYLWESKFPFFIPGLCSKADKCQVKRTETNSSAKPNMIDIETEILSEVNLTTGSLSQLWLAERKCALETTLAYCHAKNSSEPPTAYVISAGLEPHSFCGLFPTWSYYENVAQLHIDDGRKPGQQILVQEVLAELRDIHTASYSYEVLKKKPLPEGINTLCLESYLDDPEFEKVFGFNREEFYALPTWKQRILKKEKEMF